MSAPRPVVDERAAAALDALQHCLAIGVPVRDDAGEIVDFRIVFVNQSAARWAGTSRESQVGVLASEFVPALRSTGLLATLVHVVETGEPFYVAAGAYQGDLASDRTVDGVYDMGAIRHGDGYVSVWRQLPADDPAAASSIRELRDSLAVARDVVGLVRLE